jgi:hypothetical protein
MNITTLNDVEEALIENAQRELRKAYRLLTKGPEEEEVPLGQASATTLRKLAAYEAALARLQNTSGSGIGGIPNLI